MTPRWGWRVQVTELHLSGRPDDRALSLVAVQQECLLWVSSRHHSGDRVGPLRAKSGHLRVVLRMHS
jgi:hypothetical protein